MGGMRDKAQRPGIGREEQVRDTGDTSGQRRPTRGRTKEESTRRRSDESPKRDEHAERTAADGSGAEGEAEAEG
ncbi:MULTISPECIES: hypothetical protein [unclassified Streptomyces]|uniref:hypothetical protein n=1 Tax=unclassified Streptomyces TaxID=2593676 RepID=UPI001BE571B0|nr:MULTISPECIES: hypothetical protein [unclassified Streptomyces]MBT2405240.1 hypothetical protein [Streptomyces sp. ISL-21]MBT2453351.1 hypothetical protein [Streptomyces sp. ISL-86]MBT2611008.1 hypothetical protein [Streptomyces sp. ISL-87]